MDRAALCRIVEMMGRHIADGAKLLAQQHALICDLRELGVDVCDAEVRVFWFEYKHARLISRKAVLDQLLASLSPPSDLDPDLVRLIFPNAEKRDGSVKAIQSSGVANGPAPSHDAACVKRMNEIDQQLEALLLLPEDARERDEE